MGISKISQDVVKGSVLSTSNECFGADGLIFLLKNYSRSFKIKKTIHVGIIGFPNVGKSYIINSLKRSKAVDVGATPGLTKNVQEVHLDSNIKLLDCPGIIFDPGLISEADAALRNCIKIEQIEDPVLPIEAIVRRCNKEKLCQLYHIDEFKDTTDFLDKVAQKRGKIQQGGVSDINGTAKLILKDWNKGKIPYFTLPPENTVFDLETTIVQNWGEEFDLSTIMDVESKVLEEIIDDETNFMEISNQTNNTSMILENNPESNIVIGEIKIKKKETETNKKRRLNEDVFQINKEIKKKLSESKKEEKREFNNEKPELVFENYTFDTSFWESEDDTNNTTNSTNSTQESFTF